MKCAETIDGCFRIYAAACFFDGTLLLDWKLFDGFEMFANYDRMKELEKQGELNAKMNIQNTVANVISTYYLIVKQQKELEASRLALVISIARLNVRVETIAAYRNACSSI